MLVAQSCPTLCDPTDCSPPGSSVHGIFQTRILEWVAMPSCRGSSQPRDRTWVCHIAGGFCTIWATREALKNYTVVTPKPQRLKEKMFTFNSYRMSTADWQGLFFPESLKNPGWRKADWLVTSPSGMCWQHSMVPTAEERQLMSQTPVFLFFCLKLTHHVLPTVSWLPRVTRPP